LVLGINIFQKKVVDKFAGSCYILSMNKTKYPARIGLDFLENSSGERIQKTLDSWWKFAEKEAKRKTKVENFLWEPSVYLNDEP
jgi:hypothetical protein